MSSGRIKLPKGFIFHPSDEVLLSDYLELKNRGKDSEIKAIIPEINVCNHEPRDIPELVFTRAELDKEWFTMADSPDMQWYFFSPRVFVHSNGKSQSKMIKRTTKEGSWKKQGNDKTITSDTSDKPIGGKRILTFYLPKKQRTNWVIHEYFLTKANSNEQIGDYVLCRLKKNKPRKSGRSDQEQQDAPLNTGGEPGSGSCSVASNVENQASKQLENVLPILNGYDDEAEHDGGSCHITSGFENEAAIYEEYQTFKELENAVRESFDNESELKGLQTDPCRIDKNELSISVEGQPDSSSSSDMVAELLGESGDLQSPILYTKQGTINACNDESRKRKYPFVDSDTFLTKKNRIDEVDSNTASNPENRAVIPEGHSQPGENLGSDSFQSQELLSINREPRDLPHDNNDIDWDKLPSLNDGFDPFLEKFSHIDGGSSDKNSEVLYELENIKEGPQ